MKPEREYTDPEELVHSITHGIGLVLSIICVAILIVFSMMRKSAWEVMSCAIYGMTLIILYLSSTVYHALRTPRAKRIWKTMDHAAIYLLIAGTNTPFALVTLHGKLGWIIFGALWSCALAGIFFKIFFTGRFKTLSTLSYLFMGWFCVTAIKPLFEKLTAASFVLLVAGGFFYTLGALIYMRKSLPWGHAIWHLFVLAGSFCHFFSILFSVAL